MERMQEYRQAIERRMRAVCPDRRDDGKCVPPEGRRCALELDLPAIVQAIRAVRSNRIDDYARSVRELVCEHCINRAEHADCYYRDRMQCCLDNFMAVVVDAIEEVDGRYASLQGASALSAR